MRRRASPLHALLVTRAAARRGETWGCWAAIRMGLTAPLSGLYREWCGDRAANPALRQLMRCPGLADTGDARRGPVRPGWINPGMPGSNRLPAPAPCCPGHPARPGLP